jgi:flagellar basal-body rod modification protein FlgD
MTTAASTTGNYYQSLIDSVNNKQTASTSAISEVENRFLTLLTTQLQNQDPLNPMDNVELTSQIAQISTVSGIEKLNTTLQTLLSENQDSQTTLAASLLGQAVMVPGNALALSSGAAVGAFELATDADDVAVTITDSNGIAVRTLSLGSLGAGLHDFAWDGTTDDGSTAADGNYTISVAATSGSDKVTTTALTLGEVRSVISDGSGFMLDIGSLGTFTLDDVRQIF